MLVERSSANALQLRQHFQDHVIAVELREVLRDLALAERVVERVVDQLRLDAEARRLVAVDGQRQRRAAGLLVGRDAGELGQVFSLARDFGRPLIELARSASCSVYWNCVATEAPADVDVLRRLQEQRRALDLARASGRSRRMISVAEADALVARLQRDEHAAVVLGLVAGRADEHRDAGDVRIARRPRRQRQLAARHLGERDVLRASDVR